jgi:hypothetical protein
MAKIGDVRGLLRIDPDDLDSCLVDQPGLFFHVAETFAQANSRRDAIKLELDEKTAKLDQDIRAKALKQEEKLTEAAIQARLRDMPVLQELQRDYLRARTEADTWQAMKEAFHQRSYMLRELVALQLAHLQNLGVERGTVSARHAIGDNVRQRAEALRREARGRR